MDDVYDRAKKSIEHLQILSSVFYDSVSHPIYVETYDKLQKILEQHGGLFEKQVYGAKERQMILADMIEYIFSGRGYHFVTQSKKEYEKRLSDYIKIILYFVNLLMYYDSMTVDVTTRNKFLNQIKSVLPSEENLDMYDSLLAYDKEVACPMAIESTKKLGQYYDLLLPKTAGGLWHELLVYVFLIRYKLGYVIPLLLTQRFLHGGKKHLVPPDFFILTDDKRIYGIEVGTKKEIQSGSFSLDSGIPTATIDTINSRSSDRCPICGKWILFCDRIIEDFTNLHHIIENSEVRCLDGKCKHYSLEDIRKGCCPFTKYSRNRAIRLEHTHHSYSNGYHYHYQCVLNKVQESVKNKIISAEDKIALKTHFPYYQGLESLFPKNHTSFGDEND